MEMNPEQESFITTPLEFFGHSQEDIYFGYPQEYYDQIERKKNESADRINQLESERQSSTTGGAPSEKYLNEIDTAIRYETTGSIRRVNHEWYERRFRGRYQSHIPYNAYPDIELFIRTNLYTEEDAVAVRSTMPETQRMVTYLNEKIRLNEWRGATDLAKVWYETLDTEHPDKKIAGDYFGFAGNIILYEYAQIAVKLAEASTADDDFVSFKHLISVCWPTADMLEPVIPDEVARTKQILREAFLEMASRGSTSLRMYVDMFAHYSLGLESNDMESRQQNEKVGYRALLGFEHNQIADKSRMKQQLLDRVQGLVDQERWGWAIDMLDVARYSFGMEDDDNLQRLIDQYALEGAQHYLRDMSQYRQQWMKQVGKHEHPTTNQMEMMSITGEPYISEDVRRQIINMETSRVIEYHISTLERHEEPNQNQLWELLEQLASAPPEIAERFAGEQLQTWFMELLVGSATDQFVGSSLDHAIALSLIHI